MRRIRLRRRCLQFAIILAVSAATSTALAQTATPTPTLEPTETATPTPTITPTATVTPTPTPAGCYWIGALKAKDDSGDPYYELSPDRELFIRSVNGQLRGYVTYNVRVKSTGAADPAFPRSCNIRLSDADIRLLGPTLGNINSWMLGRIRAAEGL